MKVGRKVTQCITVVMHNLEISNYLLVRRQNYNSNCRVVQPSNWAFRFVFAGEGKLAK
jgi:hypothetical protein